MTPAAWPVAVACRLRLCRLLGPSLMMMWGLMSKDVGLLGPYIASDASFFKQHVSGDWLVWFGFTNLAQPHDEPCPPHDEPCLPHTLSAVSHRKAMLRGVALISRTEPLHKDPDALLLRGLPSSWLVASVCGGFNDSPVRRRHCQECRREFWSW